MAFDPAEFATLAGALSEKSAKPQEVHVRTSCGRAYYAAFLTARARLEQIGHQPPMDGTVHGYVKRALRGASGSDATASAIRDLGQRLGQIHRYRRDADYRLTGPYKSPMAFQQGFGTLVAGSARAWLDEFSTISNAELAARCPP